jgi:hypothetical protein
LIDWLMSLANAAALKMSSVEAVGGTCAPARRLSSRLSFHNRLYFDSKLLNIHVGKVPNFAVKVD